MAEDRIDSIILLAAIEKEFATVTGFLNKLKTDLSSIPPLKTVIENANAPRDLAAGTERLAAAQRTVAGTQQQVINGQGKLVQLQNDYDGTIRKSTASIENNVKKQNDLKAAIKGIGEEQKKNTKDVESGSITADTYRKKQTQLGEVLLRNKQILADVNAELKDQFKLQSAAPGSIKQAQVQNSQLTRVRNNSTDPAQIKEINSLLDKNNQLIDDNSDALAKQKINIGNYPTAFTSAFKVLNNELDTVGKKIAAGASGSELTKLTQQQQALQNATALTGKEFASTGAQAGAFKEASKQLGVVYGTNSTVFKEFNKEVGKGAKTLQEVDKEVKTAAGGTGKLVTGFKGVFSVLRNIANIIPGLGLSGIVLLLIAPLQALAASFINLFASINSGKIAVAALNEVNLKAVEIYTEEKSKVEGLVSVLKDNTASLGTKQEALKQLIAISPQYLSGLTLENLATEEGTKILDGYISSLQRKAELQAAIAVNADANKTVAALQAEKQALVDLAKQGKVSFGDLSESQQKFLDNGSLAGQFKFTADLFNVNLDNSDIKNVLNGIDDEIKKASVKVGATGKIFKDKFKASFAEGGPESIKGIIQKLRDEIDSLTKQQPTLLTEKSITENVAQVKKLQDRLDALLGKTKSKATGAKRDGSLSAIKEQTDTEFEIYKLAQERKMRLLDADIKDEKTYYLDKLELLKQYNVLATDLIKAQEKEDIDDKKKAFDRDKANLNDSKKNKNAAQVGRINQNIKILEKNLAEDIKLINQKTVDELAKINEKRVADQKGILKDQLKIEEDFAKDRIDLEEKTNDFIAKLREKQVKRMADYDKLDLDKLQEKENLKAQIISDSVKGIEDILFQAVDKRAEREKAELDEQVKNIDKKAQADIAAINASGLAESEKVKLITGIEKESIFQKEQIEKKKTDIEKKQRAARKIGAIAEIATNTAIAIFDITRKAAQAKAQAALLASNPFTAAAAPAALAAAGLILTQIPTVLAGAAINLAKVAFFKKGTQNAPKGPAVYGEEGSELVLERSGRAYLTPPQATLTQLAGGERIFTADMTKNIMNAANPYAMMMDAMKGAKTGSEGITKRDIERLIKSNERKLSVENNVTAIMPIENTAYYFHHIKN